MRRPGRTYFFYLAMGVYVLCLTPLALAAAAENGERSEASDFSAEENGNELSTADRSNRGRSSRVIEYDDLQGEDKVETAKSDSVLSISGEQRPPLTDQNSVKLITGGDPTEGSAKVGRLPILD